MSRHSTSIGLRVVHSLITAAFLTASHAMPWLPAGDAVFAAPADLASEKLAPGSISSEQGQGQEIIVALIRASVQVPEAGDARLAESGRDILMLPDGTYLVSQELFDDESRLTHSVFIEDKRAALELRARQGDRDAATELLRFELSSTIGIPRDYGAHRRQIQEAARLGFDFSAMGEPPVNLADVMSPSEMARAAEYFAHELGVEGDHTRWVQMLELVPAVSVSHAKRMEMIVAIYTRLRDSNPVEMPQAFVRALIRMGEEPADIKRNLFTILDKWNAWGQRMLSEMAPIAAVLTKFDLSKEESRAVEDALEWVLKGGTEDTDATILAMQAWAAFNPDGRVGIFLKDKAQNRDGRTATVERVAAIEILGRLWYGKDAHVDGMLYGFSKDYGHDRAENPNVVLAAAIQLLRTEQTYAEGSLAISRVAEVGRGRETTAMFKHYARTGKILLRHHGDDHLLEIIKSESNVWRAYNALHTLMDRYPDPPDAIAAGVAELFTELPAQPDHLVLALKALTWISPSEMSKSISAYLLENGIHSEDAEIRLLSYGLLGNTGLLSDEVEKMRGPLVQEVTNRLGESDPELAGILQSLGHLGIGLWQMVLGNLPSQYRAINPATWQALVEAMPDRTLIFGDGSFREHWRKSFLAMLNDGHSQSSLMALQGLRALALAKVRQGGVARETEAAKPAVEPEEEPMSPWRRIAAMGDAGLEDVLRTALGRMAQDFTQQGQERLVAVGFNQLVTPTTEASTMPVPHKPHELFLEQEWGSQHFAGIATPYLRLRVRERSLGEEVEYWVVFPREYTTKYFETEQRYKDYLAAMGVRSAQDHRDVADMKVWVSEPTDRAIEPAAKPATLARADERDPELARTLSLAEGLDEGRPAGEVESTDIALEDLEGYSGRSGRAEEEAEGIRDSGIKVERLIALSDAVSLPGARPVPTLTAGGTPQTPEQSAVVGTTVQTYFQSGLFAVNNPEDAEFIEASEFIVADEETWDVLDPEGLLRELSFTPYLFGPEFDERQALIGAKAKVGAPPVLSHWHSKYPRNVYVTRRGFEAISQLPVHLRAAWARTQALRLIRALERETRWTAEDETAVRNVQGREYYELIAALSKMAGVEPAIAEIGPGRFVEPSVDDVLPATDDKGQKIKITTVQRNLLSEAIRSYFGVGDMGRYFASQTKSFLAYMLNTEEKEEPSAEEQARRLIYEAIDPNGILRAADVEIYVFPALLARAADISQLADEYARVEVPGAAMIYSARWNQEGERAARPEDAVKRIYIDKSYLQAILGLPEEQRAILASYSLRKLQNPHLSNEDILRGLGHPAAAVQEALSAIRVPEMVAARRALAKQPMPLHPLSRPITSVLLELQYAEFAEVELDGTVLSAAEALARLTELALEDSYVSYDYEARPGQPVRIVRRTAPLGGYAGEGHVPEPLAKYWIDKQLRNGAIFVNWYGKAQWGVLKRVKRRGVWVEKIVRRALTAEEEEKYSALIAKIRDSRAHVEALFGELGSEKLGGLTLQQILNHLTGTEDVIFPETHTIAGAYSAHAALRFGKRSYHPGMPLQHRSMTSQRFMHRKIEETVHHAIGDWKHERFRHDPGLHAVYADIQDKEAVEREQIAFVNDAIRLLGLARDKDVDTESEQYANAIIPLDDEDADVRVLYAFQEKLPEQDDFARGGELGKGESLLANTPLDAATPVPADAPFIRVPPRREGIFLGDFATQDPISGDYVKEVWEKSGFRDRTIVPMRFTALDVFVIQYGNLIETLTGRELFEHGLPESIRTAYDVEEQSKPLIFLKIAGGESALVQAGLKPGEPTGGYAAADTTNVLDIEGAPRVRAADLSAYAAALATIAGQEDAKVVREGDSLIVGSERIEDTPVAALMNRVGLENIPLRSDAAVSEEAAASQLDWIAGAGVAAAADPFLVSGEMRAMKTKFDAAVSDRINVKAITLTQLASDFADPETAGMIQEELAAGMRYLILMPEGITQADIDRHLGLSFIDRKLIYGEENPNGHIHLMEAIDTQFYSVDVDRVERDFRAELSRIYERDIDETEWKFFMDRPSDPEEGTNFVAAFDEDLRLTGAADRIRHVKVQGNARLSQVLTMLQGMFDQPLHVLLQTHESAFLAAGYSPDEIQAMAADPGLLLPPPATSGLMQRINSERNTESLTDFRA